MLLSIASSGSMIDTHLSPCNQELVRSSQSSPSGVMTHDNDSAVLKTVMTGSEIKPFFIMDWLEQVDPSAIALAQQILQSPRKLTISDNAIVESPPDEMRKDIFTSATPSHFLLRSIAIGNGYNAKGIQKARLGAWGDALASWDNALEIRTQVLGESHLDVANTCNNIGIALGKLNRFEEAISSLHRALDIRIKHFGLKHVEVAATLHNVGNVYQQTGDLEAAIHSFCRCKLLLETIHATSDHVEVARACIAIGHTYFRADALLDAREAFVDALSIFERIRLPDHDPEVQATVHDIRDLDNLLQYESVDERGNYF